MKQDRKKMKMCEQKRLLARLEDEEHIEQHPLVKDTRCLKFSWWPETVPVCFLDLDKDFN